MDHPLACQHVSVCVCCVCGRDVIRRRPWTFIMTKEQAGRDGNHLLLLFCPTPIPIHIHDTKNR